MAFVYLISSHVSHYFYTGAYKEKFIFFLNLNVVIIVEVTLLTEVLSPGASFL